MQLLCENIQTFSTLKDICSYAAPIITAFSAFIAFRSEKSPKLKEKLRFWALIGIISAFILGVCTVLLERKTKEIQSCIDEETAIKNRKALEGSINEANLIQTHPFFPVKVGLGFTIQIEDKFIDTINYYGQELFNLQMTSRDELPKRFAVNIENNVDYVIMGGDEGVVYYGDEKYCQTFKDFNNFLRKKIIPEGFSLKFFSKKTSLKNIIPSSADLYSYCYPPVAESNSKYSYKAYYVISTKDNTISLTVSCINPDFNDNIVSLYSIKEGVALVDVRLPFYSPDNKKNIDPSFIQLNGLSFSSGNDYRDNFNAEFVDTNKISETLYYKNIKDIISKTAQ